MFGGGGRCEIDVARGWQGRRCTSVARNPQGPKQREHAISPYQLAGEARRFSAAQRRWETKYGIRRVAFLPFTAAIR